MRTTRWTAAALAAAALGLAGCESPVDTAPATTALTVTIDFGDASLQNIDGGMVRIRGTTNRNVSISPGETKEILIPAGTYTVALEGTTGGAVEVFGERANVVVTEGQITNVNISLDDFVPTLNDVGGLVRGDLVLEWSGVAGATQYRVEVSASPDFTSVASGNTTGTTATVTLDEPTAYYFRVRAVNEYGSNGVWSDPVMLGPCEVAPFFTLGSTVQGALSTDDCSFEVVGTVRFADFYSVSPPGPVAAVLTQQSNNPFLAAFTEEVRTVGFAGVEGLDQQVPLRIFLPGEMNTTVAVSGAAGGTVGNYTVVTENMESGWLENCQIWWASLPPGFQWTAIPATISTSDCEFEGFEGFYQDWISIYLEAGQEVQLGQESDDFDSYIELWGPSGTMVASNDDRGDGTLHSRLTYTAQESGEHVFLPGTLFQGETGSYAASIRDLSSAQAAFASAPATSGLQGVRGEATGGSGGALRISAPTDRPALIRTTPRPRGKGEVRR